MKLIINGKATVLKGEITVAHLIKEINPDGGRVAILVNDNVVRTTDHKRHLLNDGDRIEILTFAGGG